MHLRLFEGLGDKETRLPVQRATDLPNTSLPVSLGEFLKPQTDDGLTDHDAPLRLFATGIRNALELVAHTHGKLYTGMIA